LPLTPSGCCNRVAPLVRFTETISLFCHNWSKLDDPFHTKGDRISLKIPYKKFNPSLPFPRQFGGNPSFFHSRFKEAFANHRSFIIPIEITGAIPSAQIRLGGMRKLVSPMCCLKPSPDDVNCGSPEGFTIHLAFRQR
jgi:hypothetical protein